MARYKAHQCMLRRHLLSYDACVALFMLAALLAFAWHRSTLTTLKQSFIIMIVTSATHQACAQYTPLRAPALE